MIMIFINVPAGRKVVNPVLSFLIRRFIKNPENIGDPAVRSSYGMLCGGLGIVLNILLFGIKCFAGIISGSISIMTDAFNNLSDAASSVVTLIGFKMSDKKPDPEHPFGHGRIEYISGLIVSLLIIIMAVELIRVSFGRILRPEPIETDLVILFILVISILVKLYMYYYHHRIAGRIQSSALQATAIDSVSDALDTFIVLICTLITRFTGMHLDGWAGLIVGALIFRSGIMALQETISPLLGQPPEPGFVQTVEEIVRSHPMILGMHDLIVHNYGPGRRFISLHVEIPAEENIIDAHDMIDHIERELKERLGCETIIHLDPVETDDPKRMELHNKVQTVIAAHSEIEGFHDLRIVHEGNKALLMFDIIVPGMDRTSAEELKKTLYKEINPLLGGRCQVVIQVEQAKVL